MIFLDRDNAPRLHYTERKERLGPSTPGELGAGGFKGCLCPKALGIYDGGVFVSIVRVGLSETKNFAEGYDAIFGKKSSGKAKKAEASAQSGKAKKKKNARKKE